jgi:hypothetical protein
MCVLAKLLLLDNTELNEDLRRQSSAMSKSVVSLFDTPHSVFINYRKDLTKIDENLAYACWRCRLYLCESAVQRVNGWHHNPSLRPHASAGGVIFMPLRLRALL